MNMNFDGWPTMATESVPLLNVALVSTGSDAETVVPVRETATERPARSAATISAGDAVGASTMFQDIAVRCGSSRSCVSSLANAHTARPLDSAASQDGSDE